MEIADYVSYRRAAQQVYALIHGAQPAEAVRLADSSEGSHELVLQLRAMTYTDAGQALGDREIVGRAPALWAELGLDDSQVAYNAANAEMALWEIAVRDDGYVAALEGSRDHVRRARELLARVGYDDKAQDALRVQALTNLGNSLDGMGRDIDALDRYDEALAIDPTFGMALGNKGIALLATVPFVADHVPAVVRQAAGALDGALADRDRILDTGGPSALKHFENERTRITDDPAHASPGAVRFEDPYLDWCLAERLFLHVSLDCLTPRSEILDPLFFSGVTAGLNDAEQQRVNLLVDAFDALKQDYLAGRYACWLTSASDSPIGDQTRGLAARARFYDSLNYPRWGLRTGLALQAFTATINLLDKVASFVHLYFKIVRRSKVYFRTIWHPPTARDQRDQMHSELAEHLAPERFNRGLLALCDLSCDLERETPLNRLVERRHTATHRFLVAHHMLIDDDREENAWLERVEWDDLVAGTIAQLRTARAALLYLARLVDREEDHRHAELKREGGIVPTMPLWGLNPEFGEID